MPNLINPYRFGAGAGAVSGFITRGETTVNNPPWNFGALDIGTAAANRVVVVGAVVIDTGGNNQITSVTLAGNTMTRAVDTSQPTAIGPGRIAGIYYLPFASGTTAAVIVNGVNTAVSAGVSVWSIYPASSTPTGTASIQDTNTPYITSTLVLNTGGIACAIHQHNNGQPTNWSWSGVDPLTEEFDQTLGDSAIFFSAATIRGTANTTLNRITVTPVSGSINGSVACASWGA